MCTPTFRVLLALILFGVLEPTVSAKSWQSITPLRSSRKDVVRLLKQCGDKSKPCEFGFGEDTVSIVFSDEVSTKFHPCVKKLPEDTVMLIVVSSQTKIPLASLDLRRGFRKFNPSVPPRQGYEGYLDRKQGIIITSYEGVVFEMTYIASQSDRKAGPSYYENPEAIVQIGGFIHSPMMELRCPARVKAGAMIELSAFLETSGDDPEPIYIWDIPAGVPLSGRGTNKVTIDTSSLGGRTITATVRVGKAAAGCTIQIDK